MRSSIRRAVPLLLKRQQQQPRLVRQCQPAAAAAVCNRSVQQRGSWLAAQTWPVQQRGFATVSGIVTISDFCTLLLAGTLAG